MNMQSKRHPAVVYQPQPRANLMSKPWPRALIADDNDTCIKAVSDLLTHKLGFDVIQAEDGEKAYKTFQKVGDTIDLVISDLNMGGVEKNGDTLLRKIREKSPKTPLILFTDDGVFIKKHPDIADAAVEKTVDLKYCLPELEKAIKKVRKLKN